MRPNALALRHLGAIICIMHVSCSASSETKAQVAPDGSAGRVVPADAGAPDAAVVDASPVAEGSDSCLAKEPIDATRFAYSPAKRAAGSCTSQELQALAAFFNKKATNAEDVSIAAWSKEVSETCARCVFSDKSAAEWGPVLTSGDALSNVNRGGCIEIASGKRACGQAYQRVADCRIEACSASCTTAEEFAACLADVESIFLGPCKGAYDTLETECGRDTLAGYEDACKGSSFTFEGPVRAQCVTGSAK